MSSVNSSNGPVKPKATTTPSTPTPQASPAGDPGSSPDEGVSSSQDGTDSLKLSNLPDAPESVEDKTSRLAASLRAQVTSSDQTVSGQLTDKLSISARNVTNSGTMLDGAHMAKLDYKLGPNTTVFVGGATMPGFYYNQVGTNIPIASPRSAVFAGLEDQRSKHKDLGNGNALDLSLNSFAVATLATGSHGIDVPTSAGLSKATVTGEANFSHTSGNTTYTVGMGHQIDLGLAGTYYVTGGKGMFPQTDFVQGGVTHSTGDFQVSANAYVPIRTATNDFASSAKLQLDLVPKSDYLPELTAVAGKDGLENIEATKSIRISDSIDATASAGYSRPMGGSMSPWFSVGLSIHAPNHHHDGPPPSVVSPDPDYRRENDVATDASKVPVGYPRLSDFFTQDEIKAMRGKPVEELAKYLKTPEEVSAYVATLHYDDARNADSHGDYGSLTPNQVATLLSGVCRDQHPFAVEVMKEGAGIKGQTIGYMAPDTSHAIALYQDPKSGKWNVMEYGSIYYTEADSPQAAFQTVRPDALVSSGWSDGGPDQKRHENSLYYSPTARAYFSFVQPSQLNP